MLAPEALDDEQPVEIAPALCFVRLVGSALKVTLD
jgi:hypothetical protein